jgi:polyisoprenoid-binding protein YceI
MASRHLPMLFVFLGLALGIAAPRVVRGDPPRDAGVAAPQGSGSAAIPSEPPYRIDSRKSQFFVEAEAGGLLAAFAHDHKFQVRDFGGTVRGTPKALQSGSLDISIVADSLSLVDKVSDDDRREIEGTMKQKLLETAKFPKITFRSVGVAVDGGGDAKSLVKIVGNLWLHGVGHKVTIPATVAFQPDAVRATGTMKMRQTDYGMTPVTAAVGTIRVKDEITISFDIVATRP